MHCSVAVIIAFQYVALLHPLHISVCEIEMDETDRRLEIMLRVFMDDLEVALQHELNRPTLDISLVASSELDQIMEPYLNTHFKVSLDNKPEAVHYLGYEQEGQALIFYIEVSKVKRWKSIQVANDIIMDVFGDQSNLVHVTVRDQVKSLRLTRTKRQDSLSFE